MFQVNSQLSYESHAPYFQEQVVPVTVTVSVLSFWAFILLYPTLLKWKADLILYGIWWSDCFILQETTTVTQSIRIPSTSDVWVSTVVPYTVVVTHLATDYTYAQAEPGTVTSVVVVTNTPVSFQGLTDIFAMLFKY